MVRNGYALADKEFMDRNPIGRGTYAATLIKEQAFAEKYRLGMHAGTFFRQAEARKFLQDKWRESGRWGEPPFASLEELQLAFDLEWKGEGLFEIKGKLFGGMDISEYAVAAVEHAV